MKNPYKYLFAVVAAFLVLFVPALGAGTNDVYAGNQLSVVTFGTYQPTGGTLGDGRFGVGIGAELSLCRYFAVQVSTSKDTFDSGSIFQNANLSPIIRYPLGNTGFAPYAIGTVAVEFGNNNDVQYGAGGGLEYRFNSKIGTFGDYQRYFVSGSVRNGEDYDLIRAGIRYTF